MKNRRKGYGRTGRIHTAAMVITVLFLLLFGIFAVTARTAGAEAAGRRYKYYTSITVEGGDTLWSIARTYKTEEYATLRTYIREIQTLNHMRGTEIVSGSTLVIPYYSDEYKI